MHQLQPTSQYSRAKQLNLDGIFPPKGLAAELLYMLVAQTRNPQGSHDQLHQSTMGFSDTLACALLVPW